MMTFNSTILRQFGCIIVFLLLTNHANATSNIECTGVNSDADVSILIGAGPVFNALEASAAINDTVVTTYQNDDITHANIVQFSANEHELSLDLMDDQALEILASVRIVRIDDEENDRVQAGYLNMAGEAPVAITCEGP